MSDQPSGTGDLDAGDTALPAALDALARAVWPDGHGGHRAALVPPAGRDRVERYLVLPHLRSPRFVLPLDAPPDARARLLLRYNQLRSATRQVTRTALAPAVRVGLPRPRAGRNLLFAASGPGGVLETVADRLGVPPDGLVLSCGVKEEEGPARPTLYVTDRDGRPRAFVKVAVDPGQRASLQHEHRLVADLAARPAPGVLVPGPLLSAEWRGSLLVGIEALPGDVRRVLPRHRDRVLPWLDRLVASRPRSALPLARSPWTAALRARAARLGDPWSDRVSEVLDRGLERLGNPVVEHGLRHGDWSPWNMAWTQDGRLALWDWEFAETSAPIGLDEWNWPLAVDTSVRGLPMERAARRLRAAAAAHPHSRRAAELVLLDMLVRRAAQAAAGSRTSAAYAGELLALLGA